MKVYISLYTLELDGKKYRVMSRYDNIENVAIECGVLPSQLTKGVSKYEKLEWYQKF